MLTGGGPGKKGLVQVENTPSAAVTGATGSFGADEEPNRRSHTPLRERKLTRAERRSSDPYSLTAVSEALTMSLLPP